MALSKPSPNLQDIVQCSVCNETLDNPLTLKCFHSFCEKHFACFEVVYKDDSEGHDCPQCTRFTGKTKLEANDFIEQLLSLYKLIDETEKCCAKCKKKNPSLHCSQCKLNLCGNCKMDHEVYPQLQSHELRNIDSEERFSIRETKCPEHEDETRQLHCVDCSCAICPRCHHVNHMNHQTESLSNAIERLLSLVITLTYKAYVEKQIEDEQNTLQTIKGAQEVITKSFELATNQLEEDCDRTIEKIRKDHAKSVKKLESKRKLQISECTTKMKKLKTQIKERRSVVKRTDSTFKTISGKPLKIVERLKDQLSKVMETPTNLYDDSFTMSEVVIAPQNSAGTIKNDLGTLIPRRIPTDLKELSERKITLFKEYTVDFAMNQFVYDGEKLWLPEWHGRSVYASTLSREDLFIVEHTAECVEGIAVFEECVIVASKSGLIFIDCNNDDTSECIASGWFKDVLVVNQQLYALEGVKGRLYIFTRKDNEWIRDGHIKLQKFHNRRVNPGEPMRLQLYKAHIFVSFFDGCVVQRYNWAGEEEPIFASSDDNAPSLLNPCVFGADENGSILVVDLGNRRVLAIHPDGSWAKLQIEGLTVRPECAVFTDSENLFINALEPHKFQHFKVQ